MALIVWLQADTALITGCSSLYHPTIRAASRRSRSSLSRSTWDQMSIARMKVFEIQTLKMTVRWDFGEEQDSKAS